MGTHQSPLTLNEHRGLKRNREVRVKNEGLWGVISRDWVLMTIQQTKSGVTRRKQIIIGRDIGVMEGISGGTGDLPWGCRHCGRVLGCLKGTLFWNLTTCVVGISLRGGGDGGGRALPLPLPPGRGEPGWGGQFDGNPLPLVLPGHVPLPTKPWGIIPALPRGTNEVEDPPPSPSLLLESCIVFQSCWALPMPLSFNNAL